MPMMKGRIIAPSPISTAGLLIFSLSGFCSHVEMNASSGSSSGRPIFITVLGKQTRVEAARIGATAHGAAGASRTASGRALGATLKPLTADAERKIASTLICILFSQSRGGCHPSARQLMPSLDKSSTAKEVVAAFGGPGSRAGQTALITGGASGIGLETAKALAHAGCRVIIASRDPSSYGPRCDAVIRESGDYAVPDAQIVHKRVDLEDLTSVRALAEELASEPRLDYVILNAGVMCIPQRELTPAGFEKTFGINHVAHYYLFRLLEAKLRAGPSPARVIVVSSGAHMRGGLDLMDLDWEKRAYEPWLSYGASKAANILFAKQVADRAVGSLLGAVSLHPGVIQTPLWRNFDERQQAAAAASMSTKTIEQGAATTVFACLAPDWQPGAYLNDCAVARPSPLVEDADGSLRKALWEVTEAQLAKAGFALPRP